MLTSCANPACPARFLYLHDGKLFSLEGPHVVEYFWLCRQCCAVMTLVFDPVEGVRVIRNPNLVRAPAPPRSRSAYAA
jgi:hypothetical protein